MYACFFATMYVPATGVSSCFYHTIMHITSLLYSIVSVICLVTILLPMVCIFDLTYMYTLMHCTCQIHAKSH